MGHYFSILTEKDLLLPLSFVGLGIDEEQQYRKRDNDFPFFQIAYCESGSGVFSIEGNEYPIEPQTFFFFSANCPHLYYPIKKPWCVHWVLFSGFGAAPLLQAVGIRSHEVFHLKNPSAFLHCTKEIRHTIAHNLPSVNAETSGILYRFLSSLKSQLCYPGSPRQNSVSLKLTKIVNYIDSHYSEDITLDQLANTVDVSESYLCRIFRATYGESPLAYVIRYKINESKKQLIEFPCKQIKKIAKDVGFHDASYFGAVFKRYEGTTPKQFRSLFFDSRQEFPVQTEQTPFGLPQNPK